MSFGFGVGDFIAVGGLCWKVYKKCKDSSGNYAERSNEVSALYTVIKETEELISEQDLSPEKQAKLARCRQGCESVLKDFNDFLAKYESLGTKSQRTFDRMGFGMEDINSIRLRLLTNASMLDAFNNASSHARLEKKLNLLIAEVRAGKREGSVVSTISLDTASQSDRETWEALRKELEDIGISPTMITEKRQFIVAWFQEAVAAGKLEEESPSDEDDESMAFYDVDSPRNESQIVEVVHRETSSRTDRQPRTERNEDFYDPQVQGYHTLLKSGEFPRAEKPEKKSRLRASYLINKFRSFDMQILEAGMAGDEDPVEKLVRKQAEREYKDTIRGRCA